MLGTGWDADAFLVNRSRIRPLARVGLTLAAWLHVADVRSVASGSLLRREPAKSSALVLMPVASCDGESLLGSVEVRTWKGTEPMSVCDSGSGGQGCKHSVPRAVRRGDAGMSRAGFDSQVIGITRGNSPNFGRTFSDVTCRVRSRAAAHRAENRLNRATGSGPIWTVVDDVTCRVLSVSHGKH